MVALRTGTCNGAASAGPGFMSLPAVPRHPVKKPKPCEQPSWLCTLRDEAVFPMAGAALDRTLAETRTAGNFRS